MTTSVRKASPTDAPVLGQLLFDFNTEFEVSTPLADWFAERFERLLAGSDLVAFLAEDTHGRATGFALLTLRPTPHFDGPLAHLEELYVLPHLRDQGIGTLLLDASLSYIRSLGSEEIHIGVDEIDTDTRRFYEHHGFVNVEPGQGYRMLMYLREL